MLLFNISHDLFTWIIISSASQNSVAAIGGVLWGKVLLKISKNSEENTCAYVFFIIKWQAKVIFTEHLRTTLSEKYKARRNWEVPEKALSKALNDQNNFGILTLKRNGVFYNSNTNHDFLILVIWVTNFSFVIESFWLTKKGW